MPSLNCTSGEAYNLGKRNGEEKLRMSPHKFLFFFDNFSFLFFRGAAFKNYHSHDRT